MNESALKVARLWASYHLGDPSWADSIAEILTDPTEAEGNLRDEFRFIGYDYDQNFRLANRDR